MNINTPGSVQTPHGDYLEPLNPNLIDLDIEDIAHRLALKCRWGGITNDLSPERNPVHFSIAQHSCNVHDVVARRAPAMMPVQVFTEDEGPEFYALVHDASESYFDDISSPVKPHLTNYFDLEDNFMKHIINRWDVPFNGFIAEAVRRIDYAMLFWERDALVGKPVTPWGSEQDHPGGTIYDVIPDFEPWDAVRAKREFLERFNLLT